MRFLAIVATPEVFGGCDGDLGGRGVAPQTAKREWFARLIAQRVPNAEACRIVGINRRTGARWRHGREITSSSGRRLHYPPVIQTRKVEISPRYLAEEERGRIADLHRATVIQRAGSTGRSRRSGWPQTGGRVPAAGS